MSRASTQRGTVAVCTYKRPEGLRRTLTALAESSLPEEWSVLVVDNACGDDADTVVESLDSDLDIRVVDEPLLGLNHARNRALEEAKGDWVAFVDDDVLVTSTWSSALVALVKHHPSAGALCGPVRLSFQQRPPRWLGPVAESMLAAFDAGTAERALVWPEYPYGANMVLSRRVTQAIGPFRPDLDRRGDDLLSGGDKEFFMRVAASGETAVYSPALAVDHHVPPERCRLRWLLRRALAQGTTESAVGLDEGRVRPTVRILAATAVGIAVRGKRRPLVDAVTQRRAAPLADALLVMARGTGFFRAELRRALRDR